MTETYVTEAFTPEERALLEPHFTNLEGPVFALINLPEVGQGRAVRPLLAARRSRCGACSSMSSPSDVAGVDIGGVTAASKRAAGSSTSGSSSSTATTRSRSSAACTSRASSPRSCWPRRSSGDAWPRTSSSRRATCATTTGPAVGGARPCRPSSPAPTSRRRVRGVPGRGRSRRTGGCTSRIDPASATRFPKQPDDSDFVYRQTILAKTCDTLRVLLPAGDAVEPRHLRDRAVVRAAAAAAARAPAAEMRAYGDLMLVELRKVIPAFLKRVDLPDRGVRVDRATWRDDPRAHGRARARRCSPGASSRAARRGQAHRLRPRRRAEGRRRRAVRRKRPARRPAARASLARDDARRAAAVLRGVRRRARRTGGTSPGRAWERTVPVRRAVRLRRVPRPAAAPPAHARVAARSRRRRLRRRRAEIDEAGLRRRLGRA